MSRKPSSSCVPPTTGGNSSSAAQQRRPMQGSNDLIIVQLHEDQTRGEEEFTESEPEASQATNQPGRAKKRQKAGNKSGGACVHCKSLKVKCQFTPGETRCQRCVAGNHQCTPRTRKKRKVAPTHEDLRDRSRQQDAQIENLLDQFDQLRVDGKVAKWVQEAQQLARLDEQEKIARPVAPVTCHYYSSLIGPLDVDLSPSGPNYFKLPMVLRTGILEPREVIDLFNLYFERINPFFSLLDGELHCPQRLMWSSPLLFTVICACAARHYSRRGLWALMIDIARDAAAEAMIMGRQDVETVQALLILAVYPVPAKKWLEDKSWLFMGAAIRMAIEIGLDKPSHVSDIRENLNRTRTWINCFCVDTSHATQFGKMPTVKINDYVVRTSARTWYMSLDSAPYDIGFCAFAELLLHMVEYRRSIGTADALAQRFREGFDIVSHSIQYDKDFTSLAVFWSARLDADPNVQICPVIRYRADNFRMIAAYFRLVILSVGFQYSVKRGVSRHDYIFQKSIDVAQTAIQVVLDLLYPSGLLSWAMEANFLYMAFCAGFLLNLLRPKLLPLLSSAQCGTIVTLVRRLIDILSSDAVALDGRHSPAIYSKFLSKLLNKYYTPSLQQGISTAEIYPQYPDSRMHTPPNTYLWPDVPSLDGAPTPTLDPGGVQGMHVVREQDGEAEMDFSISHFVQSTMRAPSVVREEPAYHIPAPSQEPGIYGYSQDAFQEWQYPFNYAANMNVGYGFQAEEH